LSIFAARRLRETRAIRARLLEEDSLDPPDDLEIATVAGIKNNKYVTEHQRPLN
jgi:hypothetical protein